MYIRLFFLFCLVYENKKLPLPERLHTEEMYAANVYVCLCVCVNVCLECATCFGKMHDSGHNPKAEIIDMDAPPLISRRILCVRGRRRRS